MGARSWLVAVALLGICCSPALAADAPDRGLHNKHLKRPVPAHAKRKAPDSTDALTKRLNVSGRLERHSIRGVWLSDDGHVCMLMLEDRVRRSCLITDAAAVHARVVFVTDGRGLLFTFFRNAEMKRGGTSNGFTSYMDRRGSRVWARAADIDSAVGG